MRGSVERFESLRAAFTRPARRALVVSFALSLTALISPIYMTQIYDRVMSSRSEPTLIAITVITLVAIGLMSLLDYYRNIVFARAGAIIYAELEAQVFAGARKVALAGGTGRRARSIDDLETVRAFFASAVPGALSDLLFVPLILIILFLIHPLVGVVTLAFSALLIGLALINRRAMIVATDRAVRHMRQATDLAESYLRVVEPAIAMGYATRGEAKAAAANRAAIESQVRSSINAGSITAIIKGARQSSQIIIMAVAAWLALEGSITMGSIIACSILFGKAQAPIDQLVGAWRQIFQVRGAWNRLADLDAASHQVPRMSLPRPTGAIVAENVVAVAPLGQALILKGVSFSLAAGESLGIAGPSGSGKSTLARVLLGAWPIQRGTIRLDGADVSQLDTDQIGGAVGYVPQTTELMPGTIAENIRRLGPEDPEGVVKAAIKAGSHDMILSFPQGYDTIVGASGYALSGGQRQRVGLAQALYGDPALLVLDEPDNGLDREGEAALAKAIADLRESGTTIIVIAHRPALIQSLDKLLVLVDGQVQRFGTTAEVLAQIMPPSVHVMRA